MLIEEKYPQSSLLGPRIAACVSVRPEREKKLILHKHTHINMTVSSFMLWVSVAAQVFRVMVPRRKQKV